MEDTEKRFSLIDAIAVLADGDATDSDVRLAQWAADMIDPRPLNRQVLEASGWGPFKSLSGSSRVTWESTNAGVSVFEDDESFYVACHIQSVELHTIGEFRRFCSLPGIDIEVVVPEDYKP